MLEFTQIIAAHFLASRGKAGLVSGDFTDLLAVALIFAEERAENSHAHSSRLPIGSPRWTCCRQGDAAARGTQKPAR